LNSRYETSLLKRLADERKAKAIEAQRAETVKHGSVEDESAAPQGFAQKDAPNDLPNGE
jgi:hypothetical protein